MISSLHKKHQNRFRNLNDNSADESGRQVVYVMQRSLRTEWNLSLELAIAHANATNRGILVAFPFECSAHMATRRQGDFVHQHLRLIEEKLKTRGIKFIVRFSGLKRITESLESDTVAFYTEKAYLKRNRQDREEVARKLSVPLYEVEDNLISPVEKTSDKEEYAARTIRGKIDRDFILSELPNFRPTVSSLRYPVHGDDYSDRSKSLNRGGFEDEIPQSERNFPVGEEAAIRKFENWMNKAYYNYAEERQDPSVLSVSEMSPYLHFGIISPHYLASAMKKKRGKNKEAYLEELLVRRELAHNFVYFNRSDYDSYASIPGWARESLEEHKQDERDAYTRAELLKGNTHDRYWNSCMLRIKRYGYLHNHLRMYWGKGFLRYTNTPKYAYSLALEFNNTYFLDGNDPNSFANVAWIFGKHDRAFGEREIYGKVRIMTPSGLERKMPVKEVFTSLY